MATAGRLAFAAAHRMIHWVLGQRTRGRTTTHPAVAAGLPEQNIFMIDVANLPDSRVTIRRDEPHFARRKLHVGSLSFFGHEDRVTAGTANDLTATVPCKFDVMDLGAKRNFFQRKRVPRLDLRTRPARDSHPDRQSHGSKNVSFFFVGILNERDPRRAIGVIFYGDDFARHTGLVSLKINESVLPLMPSPAPAGCHPAVRVATAGAR